MSRIGLFSAAALVVGALATPALCAPQPAPVTSPAAASPFADAAPVGADRLDARGGTNTSGDTNTTVNVSINGSAVGLQDLSGVNTGNAINAASVTNGDVNIGSGAFSGFNGVGNFVVNTGNQDNINGALIVNIMAAPPPGP
jgi:hypothetical protein